MVKWKKRENIIKLPIKEKQTHSTDRYRHTIDTEMCKIMEKKDLYKISQPDFVLNKVSIVESFKIKAKKKQ